VLKNINAAAGVSTIVEKRRTVIDPDQPGV
jgi:hypothetical protein